MLNLDDIQAMSVKLREAVTKANWDEANDVSTNHSFRKLIEQNRCPAIAARMISRPKKLTRYKYDADGNCIQCGSETYDARRIADIIVNSVTNNGELIYPLTGDWSKKCVKQLYLFINGTPVARFKVKSIEKCDGLSDTELRKYVDPTPIINPVTKFRYKSAAHICDVETSGLPDDFLGDYSGKSIYDSALEGGRPLIYIL